MRLTYAAIRRIRKDHGINVLSMDPAHANDPETYHVILAEILGADAAATFEEEHTFPEIAEAIKNSLNGGAASDAGPSKSEG